MLGVESIWPRHTKPQRTQDSIVVDADDVCQICGPAITTEYPQVAVQPRSEQRVRVAPFKQFLLYAVATPCIVVAASCSHCATIH
ncbi:hypothetical protein PsYK624_082020 [Phanerochaete sordida]|uniref:Uncharacterized protein n=1 Tax=Phanerochaete sordida TaxID=48140 RepID=A0A9P3LEX7_9APHY|nr:hypothetical protein PsYK624_082020 [Phanerochaete sordida]